ncbi:MAG: APC family permease, partial [Actinobacteria bacterium]|nr:APC family permease [Actinomycetota bacterium]
LPHVYIGLKPLFIFSVIGILILLNLRGVKESVLSLLIIFLVFIFTHVFILCYIAAIHIAKFPVVSYNVYTQVHASIIRLGAIGTVFLIMSSYVMGAGTYTGIEAVSNSMPILREPQVDTAKHTLRYLAISLAFMALGLFIAYALYNVKPIAGQTLNAVLFNDATKSWGGIGNIFVPITLFSETAILFVAAQTGFIDGPRVLSYMAADNWFPRRFSILSDRLVMQNSILTMGIAAILVVILSNYSINFLIILYSINVFITFSLSQLGMVKHWWSVRDTEQTWRKKISVNGIGLFLTSLILIAVIIVKFHEGGWITLVITGSLIFLVTIVKKYYRATAAALSRLDDLVLSAINALKVEPDAEDIHKAKIHKFNPEEKTAIILVNGFTGLGLHTVYNVMKIFGGLYENFIFVQIGIVDAGNFKGVKAIKDLENYVKGELEAYTELMKWHGYNSEGFYSVGRDVVEEINKLVPKILNKYPDSTFFGGQLIFDTDSIFSKWLHNYTVFAIQRSLYNKGIPVVILPISPQMCALPNGKI